jgi:hypothetical protein
LYKERRLVLLGTPGEQSLVAQPVFPSVPRPEQPSALNFAVSLTWYGKMSLVFYKVYILFIGLFVVEMPRKWSLNYLIP